MTAGDGRLRVLFVCTANISRSAYAEQRARAALGDAPVVVSSAGTPGFPDREMDPAMATLLAERGVAVRPHTSRQVSTEILAESDLVLTFEYGQQLRLLEEWPQHMRRIFGLRQLADALARVPEPGTGPDLVAQARRVADVNAHELDVGDPYRRGPDVARACADDIDEVLDRILPALAGRDLPRLGGDAPARPAEARRAAPRETWWKALWRRRDDPDDGHRPRRGRG